MKSIVFLFVIFVVGAAYASDECMKFMLKHRANANDAQKLQLAQICKDCIKETNIQEETFEKMYNDEYPDNREMKCFFKCSSLKFGSLKENGEFDLTKPEKVLPKNRFEIVKNCAESVPVTDDKCQHVFEVHMCYVNKMKEQNIVL